MSFSDLIVLFMTLSDDDDDPMMTIVKLTTMSMMSILVNTMKVVRKKDEKICG